MSGSDLLPAHRARVGVRAQSLTPGQLLRICAEQLLGGTLPASGGISRALCGTWSPAVVPLLFVIVLLHLHALALELALALLFVIVSFSSIVLDSRHHGSRVTPRSTRNSKPETRNSLSFPLRSLCFLRGLRVKLPPHCLLFSRLSPPRRSFVTIGIQYAL